LGGNGISPHNPAKNMRDERPPGKIPTLKSSRLVKEYQDTLHVNKESMTPQEEALACVSLDLQDDVRGPEPKLWV
jgi:hypothetical protein